MMSNRVLHILSQRPGRTGSGITLAAFVRGAREAGWQQRVVVGTPTDDRLPPIEGIAAANIRPLVFGQGELDFPLPGMSDVMPYHSSVFSQLTPEQLDRYRKVWSSHIAREIDDFQPNLIHSHHIWIVSSLLKQMAPEIPVVTSCHATGFRQMQLCPHLAADVRQGCAGIDAFFVLHAGHARQLSSLLDIQQSQIHVVGAGYDESIFYAQPERVDHSIPRIVYAGKYSESKGLPSLLDAVQLLRTDLPNLELHVAGSGSGIEAESLRARMQQMQPLVQLHGQLSQLELAELLRNASLFALPSFYEGLPLVIVEALACGCRVVCSDLPGVRQAMGAMIGRGLELVPLPGMQTIDQPHPGDLPKFVEQLRAAIQIALTSPPLDAPPVELTTFTWDSVFERVHQVWLKLAGEPL